MTNVSPPRPNRLLVFEIWKIDSDKKILETTTVFFLTTNLDEIIFRWLTTVVSGKNQTNIIFKFVKDKKGGKYPLGDGRYIKWYQLR